MRRSVKGSEGNWIEMQMDTFTNWINANLHQRHMKIKNLEEGFSTGVKLINLYEVVSKRKIGKYAKEPKFHNQYMDNVSLVLKAAESDGVKIVSIDSDHIVNGNIKMILGFMWQLILRYQIVGADDNSVKIALKKLLLIWLQHVIPEQRITNLTTDWNDGVALCNLVNVLQPGLCPEYNHLDRNNAIDNVAKGMHLALENFQIPKIISPLHMANPHVDELSMMTYLSYFTQDNGIGEQWTKKLVNKWNSGYYVDNFNKDWNDGSALASLVESFAPGICIPQRPGDYVNNCKEAIKAAEDVLSIPAIITPAEMANPSIPELAIMAYTVQFTKVNPPKNGFNTRVLKPSPEMAQHEAFTASGAGLSDPRIGENNEIYVRCEENYPMDDILVTVRDPDSERVSVAYEDKNPQLRVYSYTPTHVGSHSIEIRYKDQLIPRGQTYVDVKSDVQKVTLSGEGMQGGFPGDIIEFTIDTDSSDAHVTASIEGPNNTRPPCLVKDLGDGKHKVRFTPDMAGTHDVKIAVNGKQYAGEPIQIPIEEKPANEYAQDKHLYAELYERIGISVDTQNTNAGTLTAKTYGPRGNQVATDVDTENDGNHAVSFTPNEIGEYRTRVYWNNNEIDGSPFVIWVSDPTKIVTTGEGIKQACINDEAHFNVETDGAGPGDLTCYAEHTGNRKDVEVTKTTDTAYDCSFNPDTVGVYDVFVNYNDSPIKGSPFAVNVGDPDEAVVIVNTETPVEATNEYSCVVKLTEDAGKGDVKSEVCGPDGEIVPSHIKFINEASREVAFTPIQPGRHELNIYYVGELLQGCPFIINVLEGKPASDPSKVRVTGPGIKEGAVEELSYIKVDVSEAGPGHLSATVHGVRSDVVAGIRKNEDGTYDVTYTPQVPGAYVIDVKWNDEHVDGSPFKVTVINKPNPDSVVVGGEGIKEGTAGQPVMFTLDGRKAGPGQLSCRCRAPSGNMTYVLISDNKDGTYTVDLNASEPGLHTVEVEWDGQAIPGSPFLVRIMQAPDMKKVRAHGPGLESGVLNTFQGLFLVDSKGAGPGAMKVRIHGPKGAFKVEMFRDHPKDRSINVRYNPTEAGVYTANIYWSDEHIVGSPFEIFVAKNEQELHEWKRNRDGMKQVGNSY